MKKAIFFIPAMLFAVFFAVDAKLFGLSGVSPLAYVWLGLFVVAGSLLSKGLFWGGFPGVLPDIHFMYMSTVHTGQAINIEFPLGAAVSLFYLLCCAAVFRGGRKAPSRAKGNTAV